MGQFAVLCNGPELMYGVSTYPSSLDFIQRLRRNDDYIISRDTWGWEERCVSALITAVMPLNTASNPLELSSYEDIKENFVIFYSSRDESGRMWCPVR
jgi:hypothetical protein